MQYRKLGATDIDVSAVCLGGWALIGDSTWGDQDRRASIATLRAAVDAGITFFDTAPGYGGGESEALVGEALAAVRDEVVIATKVSASHLAPADVVASCETSLGLLRTDVIDLLQIHWPRPDIPLADTLGAMQRLKEQGKIRAVGVSNFGASYLEELVALGRVETNQLCYSLLWRAVEHEVQPVCVANGLGILCYSPMCQGLLTGKFASADAVPEGRARTRLFSKDRPQARHDEPGCEAETFEALAEIRRIAETLGQPMGRLALAWLLARPGVTSVIAGARSADQVRENSRAADLDLDAETVEALSAATEPVKARIGRNADMWQTDSRMER